MAARARRSLLLCAMLALVALGAGPAASAFGAAPTASFIWFPATPAPGEAVTLVSTSTDATSPITTTAWDLAGDGAFAEAGPLNTTTFASAGEHLVQLRVTDGEGLTAVASQTIDVVPPVPTLMEPFPVVRYVAREAGSGIRLQLLSVEAPKGALVTVACRGRGCPVRSESRLAVSPGPESATVTFRRFARRLPAGVVLEIRVSRSGQIGKYTRLVIRHAAPPARLDKCIELAASAPIACPA